MVLDALAWIWLFVTIIWGKFVTWAIILYISVTPVVEAVWEALGDWAMESWRFREALVEEWKEED